MQVYISCVNWRGRLENWPSLLRIITVGECVHMRQVLSVIRGMNKFVVYVCLGYIPVAHFCSEYYNVMLHYQNSLGEEVHIGKHTIHVV